MTTEEAIKILQAIIDEIPAVSKAGRFSREHVRWLQSALLEVSRVFGGRSSVWANLKRLTWSARSQLLPVDFALDPSTVMDRVQDEGFQRDLQRAQGFLESGIDQLRRVGLEEVRRELGYVVSAGARKVFISHGHAEDVLRRVEDFVRALGLEPLVVKREASQGQALDDLVEKRMEECEAQIVLATGDDEVDGSWQPRMNVIHEVGLGQRIFKDHIIYLKEDKCEFPSNIAPKVWEPFPRDNLEPAFQKIVKELRAFGLLQTPGAARDESG
jgi:hypothetical protein